MNTRTPLLARPARVTLEWAGLAWDVGIIVLVAVNLLLIVFDTLFAATPFAGLVNALSPAFHDWYKTGIHANFTTIDFYFVAVLATDVLLGWAVAIWNRRYYRWFFYPFVHWYDVIGCVPVAGLRWLRGLRLIALGIRLQRLEIIDVRDWWVVGVLRKYYDILVEEISDRVVVNVLDGVQDEVRSGGDQLQSRVINEVIHPRKDKLVTAASARIETVVTHAYQTNREEIHAYVGNLVDRAVRGNPALAGLERVPMLGTAVTRSIEWALRDAVHNVLDEAVAGLDSQEFDDMVQRIADSVFDLLVNEQSAEAPEIRRALLEIIDLLKAQVRVQRWKQTYV